jgi:hypothetical protein
VPFRKTYDGELVYEPMVPQDLQRLRERWGFKRTRFGELLGYTGEPRNIYMTVKRMETGAREISPMVERLALMLSWFYDDHGYLPDLDNGARSPMAIPEEVEGD